MHKNMPAWAVLTLIAIVAAVLLGGTYELTRETIATRAAADADAVRFALIPDADAFEKSESAPDGLDEMYVGTRAGEPVGYVGVVTENGYGGPVQITVGLNATGVITGIRVGGTGFSETPGLGAKAKEPAFTDQFAGKTSPLVIQQDVDAVTSATITSSAVVRGVNTACDAIGEMAGFAAPEGAAKNAGQLENGRYFGVADGYGGPVYVEIALDDAGVITDIVIGDERFAETTNLGGKTRDSAFYSQFIGKSGEVTLKTDIDAVSGATVTSSAVVKAVNRALTFARDPSAAAQPQAAIPSDAVVSVASKPGYGGPIVATVTFSADLKQILAVEFGGEQFAESAGIGARIQGEDFTAQFVMKNVPLAPGDIDLLTGATISSKAAVEAVNKAYRKLVPEE